MGLKLRQDILKPLQESGGNIVLPNSLVTLRDVNAIEGQQYETGILQVAGNFASLPANTLHYVYLVAPSGVPQLVISTNVNSVGPAGFNAWQLVGAFYTNGLSTIDFGSFVTISGKPTSKWVQHEQLIAASPTSPTKGTPAIDNAQWMRDGNNVEILWTFESSTGSAGSGIYRFKLPLNLPCDTNVIDAGADEDRGTFGSASAHNFGIGNLSMDLGGDDFFMNVANTADPGQIANTIGSTTDFALTGFMQYSYWGRYPGANLTNTPLKDL